MDLATPFKTFRWQIHLPIHPSLAGCYVAIASTGERGGEFYFRETVEEVLGPLGESSAEAHPKECYFGGAVVGGSGGSGFPALRRFPGLL
jgi:hypothetical protein